IEAIRSVVSAGGRAIVLVPEIALTPQTARRFESAFERVAVLHSGLSERERFESWHAAARGEVDVVVGARSAVFAPLPQTRLIVVDEAHERTYKQESTPRYHAVDVARERMRAAGGLLVLGSATPPLEAYEAALRGSIEHLHLHTRATAQALPTTHIVDLAAEFERGNRRIFSTRLVEGIGARLARREKVVLFLNRRGTAGFLLCRVCGTVPECTRCSISLAVHRSEGLLRCHLCDAQRPIPATCPQCAAQAIREFGVGTQRVVEAAQALFPQARIVRMDSDTTTRVGDHARLLGEFERDGDILVGTQMVAKGLDFPAVTLVGVIAADIGLHLPDFRAAERTFDLLTQVAGRSGRASPGEAVIQTYAPEHPAIAYAARHDFEGFARGELAERRALGYPPFGALVYLGIVGRRRSDVVARAQEYGARARELPDVEVLGPAPFPVARMNDEWRYRLAIKTPNGEAVRLFIRERLRKVAMNDRTTRLVVNVDP
ncbi:MAG TPA: primosomal protein N', partial [Candidatus Acidoferrales bacterium]|nr:primosomal protein N' [Candidatus Acidoferrales bacterium]